MLCWWENRWVISNYVSNYMLDLVILALQNFDWTIYKTLFMYFIELFNWHLLKNWNNFFFIILLLTSFFSYNITFLLLISLFASFFSYTYNFFAKKSKLILMFQKLSLIMFSQLFFYNYYNFFNIKDLNNYFYQI